jgi:glycosyltransferase involved in cell wall biosynthesis
VRKAIHIYLSTFENESRILKETKSLIVNNIVDQVIVLARGKDNLPEYEVFDTGRSVIRVRSNILRNKVPFRGLGRVTLVLKMINVFWNFVRIINKEKPVYINLHQVLLLPLIPFFKVASPKSTFIYDAHELETETNGLKGLRKYFYKKIESSFIKTFKQIFVVSPSIAKWYSDTYNIDNVTTVMNCPLYHTPDKKDLFRKEFKIAPNARIYLYQGALFPGRGIEIILEAFALINDPKYSVVLMGYGESVDLINQYASKYSNIYFRPAVHPNIVLDYTASADVGISLIENVCLSYYYCLPNKLFEYLMAEIPCIVSDVEEMRNYVQENNTGIVCRQTTKEELLKSIIEMNNFDFNNFRKNVDIVKQKYCWESQEKTMISVYEKINKK